HGRREARLAQRRGRRHPHPGAGPRFGSEQSEGVMKPTRRDVLVLGAGMAAGAVLSTYVSPERRAGRGGTGAASSSRADEEYVWLSANAHLGLFQSRDHPALEQAGRDLGVRVRIAGPDTVDIPGLVAAVEQTAARRPA